MLLMERFWFLITLAIWRKLYTPISDLYKLNLDSNFKQSLLTLHVYIGIMRNIIDEAPPIHFMA